MTEIFVASELQCRKVTRNPFPFSEPVAYWIHRKWAYQGLARIAQGKCRNIGNARRRARKAGLDNYHLSYAQCIDGIKAATQGLNGFEAYCTGNAVKYVWRWKYKNGAEDLKKAIWYLNRLIQEIENERRG